MSDHGNGAPYEPVEVDIPVTRLLLDEENFRIDVVDKVGNKGFAEAAR